jgi:hypothetical protein
LAVLTVLAGLFLSMSTASGQAETVVPHHLTADHEREALRYVRVLGQGVGSTTTLDGSTPRTPASASEAGPMSHSGGFPVLFASIGLLVAIGLGGWLFSRIGSGNKDAKIR